MDPNPVNTGSDFLNSMIGILGIVFLYRCHAVSQFNSGVYSVIVAADEKFLGGQFQSCWARFTPVCIFGSGSGSKLFCSFNPGSDITK